LREVKTPPARVWAPDHVDPRSRRPNGQRNRPFIDSSREQARQSLFRQRTANLVDLLRQQNCIGLELFDVMAGPFAFELFEIGDAGVEASQLNVKLLNFRVWTRPTFFQPLASPIVAPPWCSHAFVNSICGGMENYSRQTWTDHATFLLVAACIQLAILL
jgi:hypothetical protein